MSLRGEAAIHCMIVGEDGAVTTSWTLLSAGVVGLAAAALLVVSAGMENVSSNVATTLEEQMPDAVAVASRMLDFDDGFEDWTAAIESHVDPLIEGALGPFYDQSGREVISNTFSLPPGTEFAVFEFDMTAIGRMEGHDDFRVFVNGAMIDATSIRDGRIDDVLVNEHDGGRVSYRFDGRTGIRDNAVIESRLSTANGTRENGATRDRPAIRSNVDRQSSYRMRVVVRDPTPEMTLGFGRGGNSPYPGEAWSIDNMSVEAASASPDAPSG